MLYTFAGQAIHSSLELTRLAVCGSPPDDSLIQVELLPVAEALPQLQDWHHQWRDGAGHVALSMSRSGTDFRLRFPAVCDVLIDHERRLIRLTPHTETTTELLQHLLVDQVLPRVLAQSGSLLVHAGAVRIGDRCVLFIGKSGWGKSTLTALLVRAGHAALSDDCVMLRTVGSRLFSTPSYPSLRLLPDSLANVFPAVAESAQVRTLPGKLPLPIAALEDSEDGQRVDAIYLLNDPTDATDVHAISAHPPGASCIALFRHAFQLDVTDHERTRALFSQCCDAVRAAPTFVLNYPRDFAQTRVLVDLITQHLDTLR